MPNETTNYQCPACTGPLRFDSASGKLCCDYCGSTYDVAQVEALYGEKQAQADKAAEAAEKAASSGPVWGEMETGDLSSRTCTSCGAELVCGPETAATTCPYCGNPTVLGGQLSGKLKPEYIIPFRMDKKTAIENLKKYYKGKAFLPKAFKESNHIEEIQGVYVPFWLYDGRMEARGAYKAEISESHREGDYIVTTTRHFDVARVGDADFVRVPVDGSSKMPDAHMDAIEPFDYSDLKPFSTAYLPGFLADRYDEDDKKCAARVLTRMKNSTAAALHDTLGVYTGAYMGEVVRAAIESVPKGQFEAAQAQGFSYLQRMGYIILPQSIPVMLPPMVNQVVNLFKNTSCLYIVGGADLISVTYSFVTGASTGGAYAPAYIVCGLIFFVVCFPLSTLAARWEASLKERKGRVNPSLKTAARKVELKEAA